MSPLSRRATGRADPKRRHVSALQAPAMIRLVMWLTNFFLFFPHGLLAISRITILPRSKFCERRTGVLACLGKQASSLFFFIP